MRASLPTGYCRHCHDEEIVWSRLRGGRVVRFCMGCDEPVEEFSAPVRYRSESELSGLGYSFAEAVPPEASHSCGSGSCGSGCGCSTGGGCSTCSKVDTCHKIH